jgi:hypothetical protein
MNKVKKEDVSDVNDTVLTRKMLWQELRNRGWPITWLTFQRMCGEGKGPQEIGQFGTHKIYTLDAGLAWCNDRIKQGETAA